MQFWGEYKMPLDINGQGSISGITSLNTVVSDAELERLDGVTSAIQTQLNGKLPIAGGKILQIVRATDTTNRSTTSASFVDITGMSVTITPQKNDSAIIILVNVSFWVQGATDQLLGFSQITDNSNNPISGAQAAFHGTNYSARTSGQTQVIAGPHIRIGYVTPATTSAVTYKFRARTDSGTVLIQNGDSTGTMYAIEVSA